MAKKKNQPQGPYQVEISDQSERLNSSLFMDGSRTIEQQLAPSSIVYTSEHELKVENNYVRTFVINGYPSRVSLRWLDDIYCYRGDMDASIFIEPSNERNALDELTMKITQYEAQYMTEVQKGSIKNLTMLDSKIQALYQQRARLEQNYESMFHVATFCSLYGHELKELNKDAQKFQSRLAGSKMGIMPLTLRQDDGYKSVSPYGTIAVTDYYRNMNTGALSTMFPFYNAEINHPNGTFVGINQSNETPIFIDFFNRKALGNTNLFISGASGSGKSYLTSLITMRSSVEGIRTVIIDPENEYQKCTDAQHGVSIRLAPDSDNSMNPFDIDEEIEIDEGGRPTGRRFVDIKGKAAELLNLFGVMFPEDMNNSVVKSKLSEIFMGLYAAFGITSEPNSLYREGSFFDEETGEFYHDKILKTMPRLSDCKKMIERVASEEDNTNLASIGAALSMYCEGGVFSLFDCYTTVDTENFNDAPIIRFDIQGIEDEMLRPIGMHIVLSWTWNKFIKKDLKTKKRIVCDEAWMMLQKSMAGSDYTALFLEKCARRIRKYNGSLCCASQNFREFVSRQEGLSILSNSAVRMFLRQEPDDINAVGDRFIMSDGEKANLLSAKRGDLLIKVGKESILAQVFAFPFEHRLIAKEYLEDDVNYEDEE